MTYYVEQWRWDERGVLTKTVCTPEQAEELNAAQRWRHERRKAAGRMNRRHVLGRRAGLEGRID